MGSCSVERQFTAGSLKPVRPGGSHVCVECGAAYWPSARRQKTCSYACGSARKKHQQALYRAERRAHAATLRGVS